MGITSRLIKQTCRTHTVNEMIEDIERRFLPKLKYPDFYKSIIRQIDKETLAWLYWDMCIRANGNIPFYHNLERV